MSKPNRIEAEPFEAPDGPRPARLTGPPQVRRVDVDPADIFPQPPLKARRLPFSFELIVSRYILLSGCAVVGLMALILLSLAWLRR